ncbi:MAG TPA: hypothetical protein VI216_09855 [Candidatus Acidoferrales bacterium]
MTSKPVGISSPILSMVLAGITLVAVWLPVANSIAGKRPVSATAPQLQGQPPSAAEMSARTEKLLANQHADDEALELYQRVERHIDRSGDAPYRIIDDKTYRVVPTGAGTQKILLRDGDKPVDAATYNRGMRVLAEVLRAMADPNDPKARAALAKRQKRARDRAEFVDAMKEAFLSKWLSVDTRNGRQCDVVELDPNPNFHPHSMFQNALSHVTAKIWVDRESNQLVWGEAHVMSDISIGGGILGKVYRGSRISMEQEEVAPGIWLPTHYRYDFTGRKFLFAFQEHETIDVSHYHRIGSPKEALALVEAELAGGKTYMDDP